MKSSNMGHFDSGIVFILALMVSGSFTANVTEPKELLSKLGLEDTTPAEKYRPCGDGWCRCSETTADCSNHHGRLTYVPRLPSTIKNLDLSNNRLKSIPHGDFFLNVSGVRYILLCDNEMAWINPEAFRPLKKLTIVNLNGNRMNYPSLKSVFTIKSLELLAIRENNLDSPPDDLFHGYSLPNLKYLDLGANNIHAINLKVFQPLTNLQELNLHVNRIGSGLVTAYLQNLEVIMLHENLIPDFPETCGPNGTSLFPRLNYLDLADNGIKSIKGNVCLPKLTSLSLSENPLLNLTTNMFGPSRFPALETLEVTPTLYPQTVYKNAFKNPTLKHLTTSMVCNLAGGDNNFDNFAGCTNLQSLNILWVSYRTWDNDTEQTFIMLFGGLKHLRSLDFSLCKISELHPWVFSHFQTLENFTLANNRIMTIPGGAFDNLTNLKRLSLAGNMISVIKDSTFSSYLRHNLQHLDISQNPFVCSCDLLWFHHWLTSDPQLFASKNQYLCHNMQDTPVVSVLLTDQQCLLTHEQSGFIILTFVVFMLTLTLTTVFFRYRWHIRLMPYEAFRGKGRRLPRLREEHFQYDVFVAYDRRDLHWVFTQLIPELEGRMGLRLCVHERDFIVGNNIVDNIAECVERSKKVMMVFSKNFSQSEWCQFELNYCLRHVLHHDDTILVVVLEDIPSRDLTPAMMAVMKTTTYIEWADEPKARASFWGRLSIALTKIPKNEKHMPGLCEKLKECILEKKSNQNIENT